MANPQQCDSREDTAVVLRRNGEADFHALTSGGLFYSSYGKSRGKYTIFVSYK